MARVAYATLAMYIGRSLRGGERSLRFFRPPTRYASSTRWASVYNQHGTLHRTSVGYQEFSVRPYLSATPTSDSYA